MNKIELQKLKNDQAIMRYFINGNSHIKELTDCSVENTRLINEIENKMLTEALIEDNECSDGLPKEFAFSSSEDEK